MDKAVSAFLIFGFCVIIGLLLVGALTIENADNPDRLQPNLPPYKIEPTVTITASPTK